MRNQILYTAMSLMLLNVAVPCHLCSSNFMDAEDFPIAAKSKAEEFLKAPRDAFRRANQHAQCGDVWGAYEIDKATVIEFASFYLKARESLDDDYAKQVILTIVSELKRSVDKLGREERYHTEKGKKRFKFLVEYVKTESDLIMKECF